MLTESAKFDAEIVSKIKAHIEEGGNIVITSGLLNALQDKGMGQIADIRTTGNILNVQKYWGAYGPGAGADLGATSDVLVPEIVFETNDAWPIVRGTANGRGAPLLIMDRYSKGILYVLTIPENPNDFYSLPQGVLTQIKHYLLDGFPMQVDAPSKVSLFAYDNHTFVVESYLDTPAQMTVSIPGVSGRLRNLATGELVEGKTPVIPPNPFRRTPPRPRTEFHIELQPHSFAAFGEE